MWKAPGSIPGISSHFSHRPLTVIFNSEFEGIWLGACLLRYHRSMFLFFHPKLALHIAVEVQTLNCLPLTYIPFKNVLFPAYFCRIRVTLLNVFLVFPRGVTLARLPFLALASIDVWIFGVQVGLTCCCGGANFDMSTYRHIRQKKRLLVLVPRSPIFLPKLVKNVLPLFLTNFLVTLFFRGG